MQERVAANDALLEAVANDNAVDRPREASQVRPNRLSYYTVKLGDSWQSIAQRAGRGITNAATLAIMNGH